MNTFEFDNIFSALNRRCVNTKQAADNEINRKKLLIFYIALLMELKRQTTEESNNKRQLNLHTKE